MDGIVVVSGGGTGIGKAVAETFARDGRRVVIGGRREPVPRAAADEIGAGVVPLAADLTDVGQVERTAGAKGDRLAAVARGWEAGTSPPPGLPGRG
jgi:3-oxoacyl-[acyl-carrier protein] reductase